MIGWQWHQLDHMQVICTLLQTDNHASTSSLHHSVFYRPLALPAAQSTARKYRRHDISRTNWLILTSSLSSASYQLNSQNIVTTARLAKMVESIDIPNGGRLKWAQGTNHVFDRVHTLVCVLTPVQNFSVKMWSSIKILRSSVLTLSNRQKLQKVNATCQ